MLQIKKFLKLTSRRLSVYKDHVEVVFFFCADAERAKRVRLTVMAARGKLAGRRAV